MVHVLVDFRSDLKRPKYLLIIIIKKIKKEEK